MKRFVLLMVLFLAVKTTFSQNTASDTVWTKYTYPYEVKAVKFTPDGKYVATGGTDAIPKIWDAENGKLVKEFPGRPTGIYDISIANNMIAFSGPSDNGIQIYDLNDYHLIKSLQGSLNAIFTTDGNYLLTGLGKSEKSVGISIIDTKTWLIVNAIDLPKSTISIAISPNNKYVARAGNYASDNPRDNDHKGELVIYSFPDLNYVTTLENKDYFLCNQLCFSPDNKYLAGALSGSVNKIWNTSDWS